MSATKSLDEGSHPLHLFYSLHIDRQIAARISGNDLREAYLAWATRAGMPALSSKDLRRAMMALGHRHVKSNRMWFVDAAMRSKPRSRKVARAVLAAIHTQSARQHAVGRVDAIVHQLAAVSRELADVRLQLDLPFAGDQL